MTQYASTTIQATDTISSPLGVPWAKLESFLARTIKLEQAAEILGVPAGPHQMIETMRRLNNAGVFDASYRGGRRGRFRLASVLFVANAKRPRRGITADPDKTIYSRARRAGLE